MEEKKISNITAIFMITIAVIFDLLQFLVDLLHFIPAIGNAIAFIFTSVMTLLAAGTFYLWFKFKGVSFNTSKRMLSYGGGFLLELIPILNALPAWTLAVVLIIGTTRLPKVMQDAGKIGGLGGGSGNPTSKT